MPTNQPQSSNKQQNQINQNTHNKVNQQTNSQIINNPTITNTTNKHSIQTKLTQPESKTPNI